LVKGAPPCIFRLCIPKHGHLVGPAVVSTQEPGWEIRGAAVKLVRAHASPEHDTGKLTGSEAEHKRRLAQRMEVTL